MALRAMNSEALATTIADFVGDFVSTGEQKIISGSNAEYYPAKGVMLRVIDRSNDPYPHARIQVLTGDDPPYSARRAVEAAKYQLLGNRLVAVMELQPGLILTELLEMREDRTMKHSLNFTDGASSSLGYWICQPK